VEADQERTLERLAQAVRRARRTAAMTQEAVAFGAGVSVRHFQELESGRLNPSYVTLRAVAAAMGTTLVRMLKAVDS
jgi:transcriptional regulator with XRE-family HTH domain